MKSIKILLFTFILFIGGVSLNAESYTNDIPLSVSNPDDYISIKEVRKGNDTTTIMTYADGSTRSAGISGGSCVSGSGYSTCTGRKVYGNTIGQNISFKSDYTLVNGAYDYISRRYDAIVSCTGQYSCTRTGFDTIYSKETADHLAQIKLSYDVKVSGIATKHQRLKLFVGKNKTQVSSEY